MDKQTKLAVNLQQDFTEAEKAQGRANLGLAQVASTGSYNDLSNTPAIPPGQVQSDWNQTDTTSVSYIQNKPRIHTYKDYATSYDYPDCMHVRTPGAHSSNSASLKLSTLLAFQFKSNCAEDPALNVYDGQRYLR